MCSDCRKNHGCGQEKTEDTGSSICGVEAAAKWWNSSVVPTDFAAEPTTKMTSSPGNFSNFNYSPSTNCKQTTEYSFELFLSVYSLRSEVYKFVAWGSHEDSLGRSNLDRPIYISMVSAQLPSNKTKSQPLTVARSHVSSACFFISCWLRCVHLRADMFIYRLWTSKDSNAWFNKWLKILSGGDLQLKLSVNADLKFSANNEGDSLRTQTYFRLKSWRQESQESAGREHCFPVIA